MPGESQKAHAPGLLYAMAARNVPMLSVQTQGCALQSVPRRVTLLLERPRSTALITITTRSMQHWDRQVGCCNESHG